MENLVTGLAVLGQNSSVWSDTPIKVRYISRADTFTPTATYYEAIYTLYDKTFGMIGDSYVKGNNTSENLVGYYRAAKILGMHYHNYGVNGNTIAIYPGITSTPMSERFVNKSPLV